MNDDISDWLARERATMEQAKKDRPELFMREPIVDSPEMLKQAGIELPKFPSLTGYIRLMPQDFIVEEIQTDGKTISVIEPGESEAAMREPGQKTIYADLVKAGIPTPEAKNRLSVALGIEQTAIGTSGIKDAVALTSQRVSFRDVDLEKLRSITVPNLFLTRFSYGKGAFAVGDLYGNRFTIVVRTDGVADPAKLSTQIESLKRDGSFNFYGLQRFGTRLLSHWFGLLLLRGEYDRALEAFLFQPGSRDLPFFVDLRERAKALGHDWKAIHALYAGCAYTLQYELRILEKLIAGADAVQAFSAIPEQIKLWIYAYMSYLVNHLLSEGAAGKPLPQEVPVPLSNNPADRDIYRSWLESDGVTEDHFPGLMRAFPFIRLMRRTLPTRVTAADVRAQVCAPGIALTFTLPRGAYGTTYLMHLFLLAWGRPVPPWVKTDEVDAKALFGTGSVKLVKPLLGQFLKPLATESEEDD